MLPKIGLFGGTFDPIHFGHIHLALFMLETYQLDQVFFCPANFSPEKAYAKPVAAAKARKEMVAFAIKDIPSFTLIENEIQRDGPSYTIDTVREIHTHYPDVQWHLILGEDVLQGLASWKEIDSLLDLAPPLIGGRNGKAGDLPETIYPIIKKGMTLMPVMEISATVIRKRLKEKKYCGHLLPAKVLDYIHTHEVY